MVESILMAISLMWFPVGLLLLGKGEPKGTGALVLMVGTLVLVSAVIEAAVFKDPFLAALLFRLWPFLLHRRLFPVCRTAEYAGRRQRQLYVNPNYNYLYDPCTHRGAGFGRRQAVDRQEQFSGAGLCRLCGSLYHGLAQCIRKILGQDPGRVAAHMDGSGSLDPCFLVAGRRQAAILMAQGG